MGLGEMWFITLGVLVSIIGFGGGIFIYALKLVLKTEDAYRVDPVPPEKDH